MNNFTQDCCSELSRRGELNKRRGFCQNSFSYDTIFQSFEVHTTIYKTNRSLKSWTRKLFLQILDSIVRLWFLLQRSFDNHKAWWQTTWHLQQRINLLLCITRWKSHINISLFTLDMIVQRRLICHDNVTYSSAARNIQKSQIY